MKLNPLSWVSDWADKHDIPVEYVWAALIVVGLLLSFFLFSGGAYIGRWL